MSIYLKNIFKKTISSILARHLERMREEGQSPWLPEASIPMIPTPEKNITGKKKDMAQMEEMKLSLFASDLIFVTTKSKSKSKMRLNLISE